VCARANKPALALEVLASMPAAGVLPNAKVYRATLDACRKAGQWKHALELLQTMERSGGDGRDGACGDGLLPDLYAYNTCLLACARAAAWKPALEILDKMDNTPKDKELAPNVVSFGAAVCASAAANQWKLCWQLVAAMDARGVHPNAHFFAALLGACNRSGQWSKALQCYTVMQARRDPPYNRAVCLDLAVLRSVLQACAEGKQAAHADLALQHAVRDGVSLDLPLVDLALAALTHGQEGASGLVAVEGGEATPLGAKVAAAEGVEGAEGAASSAGAVFHAASSSNIGNGVSGAAAGSAAAEAPLPHATRIAELRELKAFLLNRAASTPKKSPPNKYRLKRTTPRPQEQQKPEPPLKK
jgi:pentatricopeptide repeat protein